MKSSLDPRFKLNAACPYFTMFPLEFPLQVLSGYKKPQVVLDVFCGRGTTNFASRFLGHHSYGIDASPVAVAIAKAKLSTASTDDVLELARHYLSEVKPKKVPTGDFWINAYHPATLRQICQIREGLMAARASNASIMLRALMLGCLHGPLSVHEENAGYFSNQMPRTYASKPDYAVKFWRAHKLKPRKVDVLLPLAKKARSALAHELPFPKHGTSAIATGDSQKPSSFKHIDKRVGLVITSPPYLGLRTYIEDQWIRNWFLGGPSIVPYGNPNQLSHGSPEGFATSLSSVWDNVAGISRDDLKMVIRFGSIGSERVNPETVLRRSFELSSYVWKIKSVTPVGTALRGKRQAATMGTNNLARREIDVTVGFG